MNIKFSGEYNFLAALLLKDVHDGECTSLKGIPRKEIFSRNVLLETVNGI